MSPRSQSYEIQHESARLHLQMRTARAMQSVEREAHYAGCYVRGYLSAAVDFYIAMLPTEFGRVSK